MDYLIFQKTAFNPASTTTIVVDPTVQLECDRLFLLGIVTPVYEDGLLHSIKVVYCNENYCTNEGLEKAFIGDRIKKTSDLLLALYEEGHDTIDSCLTALNSIHNFQIEKKCAKLLEERSPEEELPEDVEEPHKQVFAGTGLAYHGQPYTQYETPVEEVCCGGINGINCSDCPDKNKSREWLQKKKD